MNHVGDDAELYALGVLPEDERAAIDAHVAVCDECAARVGQAEAAVAATITAAEPSAQLDARVRGTLRRRSSWFAVAAIAAAFVFGLVISAAVFRAGAPVDTNREQIAAALVASHFAHAPFTALTPDAPKAKMLYGRAQSGWVYVVAATHTPYVLKAIDTSGARSLGTLQVNGESAELFLPGSPARTYGLFDGSREVATVTLPYRR